MASSSSLRIVAAGRGRTMSHPRIVETVVNMTGISRPKLVYLGTATYDKEEPYHIQTDGFCHQCQVIKLDVSEAVERIPSTAEIQETLQSANIVMVGGGNTLYAMNRWKALGVEEILKRIAKQGVVLCGGSAGAICWFEHGHSDSMDPTTFLKVDPNLTEQQKRDWEYIRVKGLGMLPAMCAPHHDATQSNGMPRSLDSDAMMLELPDQPCLGIDEAAALVIENGTARVISTDDVGQCYLKQCKETKEGYDVIAKAFGESRGAISLEDLWQGKVQ